MSELEQVAREVQQRLERLEIAQAAMNVKLDLALAIATGILILTLGRLLGVG